MSRWIKVDVATPEKSEVLACMEDCQCTQGEAFLAWFRVWAWLDERTTDGWLPRMTPKLIDGVARLPGFSESMQRSGWLTFQPDGCMVANWCRHNGACAKRRAQEASRLAAIREEKRKVGEPVRSLPVRPRRK